MPRYDSFLSLQSTLWFQAQFDLTLAALGKNVKKQQEVSDLNQDYNIPPMISQSQISCNTPTFYIAAIFVKYCYTTGSWLL